MYCTWKKRNRGSYLPLTQKEMSFWPQQHPNKVSKQKRKVVAKMRLEAGGEGGGGEADLIYGEGVRGPHHLTMPPGGILSLPRRGPTPHRHCHYQEEEWNGEMKKRRRRRLWRQTLQRALPASTSSWMPLLLVILAGELINFCPILYQVPVVLYVYSATSLRLKYWWKGTFS